MPIYYRFFPVLYRTKYSKGKKSGEVLDTYRICYSWLYISGGDLHCRRLFLAKHEMNVNKTEQRLGKVAFPSLCSVYSVFSCLIRLLSLPIAEQGLPLAGDHRIVMLFVCDGNTVTVFFFFICFLRLLLFSSFSFFCFLALRCCVVECAVSEVSSMTSIYEQSKAPSSRENPHIW